MSGSPEVCGLLACLLAGRVTESGGVEGWRVRAYQTRVRLDAVDGLVAPPGPPFLAAVEAIVWMRLRQLDGGWDVPAVAEQLRAVYRQAPGWVLALRRLSKLQVSQDVMAAAMWAHGFPSPVALAQVGRFADREVRPLLLESPPAVTN